LKIPIGEYGGRLY